MKRATFLHVTLQADDASWTAPKPFPGKVSSALCTL